MKNPRINLYELNVIKLKVELAKIEKTQSWLADQMGVSRQYIHYLVKEKKIKRVEDMARVLNIEAKELVTIKYII